MPANSFNPYPTLALFLLASTFLVIELNAQNANPAQRFQQFDRNNDGKVTRAEAGDPPWFDRFDRNGDDAIEQSELPGGNTANPDRRSAGTGDLKAPPEPAHTEHLNIAYDEIDGVDPNLLSLDLYVPDDESTDRPVMIMIHGGGWRGGDKASPVIVGNKMRHFLGGGYIYASINYRLSPPEPGQDGIKHPVHAEDCAKAIGWIHDHIGEYGGDPNQLHLMGHSAGGHLAAILATNERFLAAHDKDLSILKTNVLLDPAAIDIPRYIELVDGRAMTPLYHLAFGDDADNLRDASPQQNIAPNKSIPPTLLFYGGERMLLDQIAPPFTAALTKAGTPSQAVDTITLDHGQINSHIGMLDEPMTKLIMRLHAGEDASTFPARLDNSKKPPATTATPDPDNAGSTIPDIAYGDHDAQKLDLYLPANPDKAPVMIYVHGGGWRRGDKSSVGLKPAFFTDENWIFASTNYRLLPDGRHPNNVNDVASAIAWLHENIADHGGDPDKIFIMGHSAGCHLVSLVATDERPLALHDLPLSTIKGVIANDTQAYDVARLMETNPSELYAQVFGENHEAQRDASPFHHVDKNKGIPPFLILYSSGIGSRTNPLRPVYANAFADTLRSAGIEAAVIDGSDRDHGQINQRFGDPEDEKITGAAQAFLESLLNTETVSPTPLSFTRDYIPGTTDTKGNFMGGTETMRIIPHNDQLFAGLSFWTDQRGDDPFPGAQILVKSGPDEPWQVSKNIPGAIRVSAMETITFSSDHEGNPLPNPVSLLVSDAGLATARDEGPMHAHVFENQDWSKSTIREDAPRAFIRAFGSHRDTETGIAHIFAGTGAGEIYRGAYNPDVPGKIEWHPEPEYANPDFDGGAFKRCQGFCVANGKLYASVAPRLLERQDGPNPKWVEVFRWNPEEKAGAGLRGITAVPAPNGDHEIIIGSREQEGRILRIDPTNDFQIEVELDSRAFLQETLGSFRGGKLVAYNQLVPGTHPVTGAPIHWLSVAGIKPGDINAAWLLIRNADATYEPVRVHDPEHPNPRPLVSTRTIAYAPWSSNEIYTGGYDGAANNRQNHNTAWIYRAELPSP